MTGLWVCLLYNWWLVKHSILDYLDNLRATVIVVVSWIKFLEILIFHNLGVTPSPPYITIESTEPKITNQTDSLA